MTLEQPFFLAACDPVFGVLAIIHLPFLPLHLICPVCCAHLALLDVRLMASLEGCATLLFSFCRWGFARALHTLLAEANDLLFAALTRLHDVRLLRVRRSTPWLVARHILFGGGLLSHQKDRQEA